MCSPMERDCRRRIVVDAKIGDVQAEIRDRQILLTSLQHERSELSGRIIKALRSTGQPNPSTLFHADGRTYHVRHSDWGGLQIDACTPIDSPLFAQPPVADAVADSPSDEADAYEEARRPVDQLYDATPHVFGRKPSPQIDDGPDDDDDPTVKADVKARVDPFRRMVEGGTLPGDDEAADVLRKIAREADAEYRNAVARLKAEAAEKREALLEQASDIVEAGCGLVGTDDPDVQSLLEEASEIVIDPDDIDATLDPRGNLAVEIEREARRSREAIIRDGVAADIDPVAGLGSLLGETRCGEPRIPTIRDGKPVGALEALASIRSALRSDDPITEAAVHAAMEDDGGFPLPGYSDDETVVPDVDSDSHAVVETQAVS